MAPPSAADVQPQLPLDRRQAALERSQHAGGDPRAVPVHAHHAAERLEPERVRQPPQHFVTPVVQHQRLDEDAPEPRHARRQRFP